MIPDDISRSIEALTPGVPCSYGITSDGDVINWSSAGPQPTTQAIIDEDARYQAIYTAQEYSRTRKAAYDLLNQDEMRYDDLVNGTTTWQDSIENIKNQYPKPL